MLKRRLLAVAASLIGALLLSLSAVEAQVFPLKSAHLVSREKCKVSGALSLKLDAPNLEALEWIYYAPYPPDLPEQQKLSSLEMLVDDKPFAYRSQLELSPLHRKVLLARIPCNSLELKKHLYARVHYFLTLNSKELVQGAAKSLATISAEEKALYLKPTKSLDFDNQDFQSWLSKHNLRKESSEKDIDFAWRTYQKIRRLYQYNYDPLQNRSASNICKCKSSDCGGLSYLFSSILRANGVAARPLIGRWLKKSGGADSADNGYGQVHVKSEFFADSVGWIPVDMSFGVSNPDGDGMAYFGHFAGDFITFHVDPDVYLDSFWFGKKEFPYLQNPAFWVTGSGNLSGLESKTYWQTRE
ncbi:MAG: transglutaminase-like domain-containing protein [Candidatus Obscuribacterales bacterium]|nr:transglutaminase-like domain-containing protein [Candidatus Obscuribacterales bacterium]